MGDHVFYHLHNVVVVGVGLVAFDSGELGIVIVVESFVTEQAPDLEYPFDSPDDQFFKIELGGYPQEQVAVELVVVGFERGCLRAGGDRNQDWSFDLDKTTAVHEFPHGPDHV